MTSKQLAAEVLYEVTRLDLATAPLPVLRSLMTHLNLALADWLLELPADRRKVPFGTLVRAPITQEVAMMGGDRTFAYLAGGSAYPVGGYASEEDVIGATARVANSVNNTLVGPGTLLVPFEGASTDATLTVYGDAVHLPLSAWAVEGDVMLLETDGTQRRVLEHNPQRQTAERSRYETGTPKEWWTEPVQPLDQEDSRRFVMRIWPLPDAAFQLRCSVSQFPAAFALEDLFENRSLPFLPMEASLFITAAIGLFSGSSHVSEAVNPAAMIATGTKAMTSLKGVIARPASSQPSFLGTPKGF